MQKQSAGLQPEFLRRAHRRLLVAGRERRRMIERLNETGLNRPETVATGELSSYDNHPADQGTETFEREKDLSLKLSAQEDLRQIEAALRRIERGSYGICERCGQPIGMARLEAVPWAVLCIACQEREESERGDRLAASLPPGVPFATGWHDPLDPGIEGGDVWAEVARYGTAASPSDIPYVADYEDIGDEPPDVAEDVEAMIDETGEPLRHHWEGANN